MDLTSNCPKCPEPVTCWPCRTELDPGGMRAHYRCRVCGHRWWTGWGLTPEELAEYSQMAEAA